MGKHWTLLNRIASLCGLVQSIIWLGLSIVGCLTYLCVIPVEPYTNGNDFFRVTFVKLYFEGPKCIPNGSYLGKFNEDYKNPEKINLLTPDIVFAATIAKIIFDSAHIVLCILLYRTNKTKNYERLFDLVVGWSVLTLISSGLDAFCSVEFLLDVFSLTRYLEVQDLSLQDTNLRGIQFIPLILGIIFSRIVIFWFWNVIIALYLLFANVCCKDEVLKEREDFDLKLTNNPHQIQTFSTEFRRRLSDISHSIQDKSQTDWDVYSMEAITRFNEGPEHSFQTYLQRAFTVSSPGKQTADLEEDKNNEPEEMENERHDRSQNWNKTNAAYEKDEGDSDRSSIIFDLKKRIHNCEAEDSKSSAKRLVGKPVNVPVPPAWPKSDWSQC